MKCRAGGSRLLVLKGRPDRFRPAAPASVVEAVAGRMDGSWSSSGDDDPSKKSGTSWRDIRSGSGRLSRSKDKQHRHEKTINQSVGVTSN